MKRKYYIYLDDKHVRCIDFLIAKGLVKSFDGAIANGLDLLIDKVLPDYLEELGRLID